MSVHSISVGKRTFNVTEATAVNQRTLASLLNSRIMANCLRLVKDGGSIDVPFLIGVLYTEPEASVTKIHGIVLWQAVESGKDTKLTLDDFQNQMHTYFTLLAECIKVNLGDFIEWLQSEYRADPANEQTQQSSK